MATAARTAATRLCVCLLLLLPCGLTGCSRFSHRPNVVVIVIDSLRADHVGCYGYGRDTTPALDRLAQESVRFENAVAQAPWTLPSVGSMLTSQYPSVLGVHDQAVPLDPRFPLLPELLRKRGYETAGIFSGPLLAPGGGFGRGFETYLDVSGVEHESVTSAAVTEKAIAFLRSHKQKPFFLFLHYFDPHYNYVLDPEFDFYSGYQGAVASGEPIRSLWDKMDRLTPDDVKGLRAFYDSEIAHTDKQIGFVLGELRRRQLFDNTLVVITGDHGEELMERGWIGHTIHLSQQVLHVPLLIKPARGSSGAGRAAAPAVCGAHVGLIDVMPTVLAQLSLPLPKNLEGRPLDLAAPARIEERPVFSETFNPQRQWKGAAPTLALRSVVLGDHKYVLDQVAMRALMYDLAADPDELAAPQVAQSEEWRRLGKVLGGWLVSTRAKESTVIRSARGQMFDKEQTQRLRSLGYL